MTRRVLLAFAFAAVALAVPASAQLFRRPAVRLADVPPAPIDLQGMVDAAIAARQQEVRLPAGVYRLTAPLVLGRNDLSCVRLVGAGKRTDNHSPFGGTVLVADFDGPAVVVRLGRGSGVESLSIYGPYLADLLYKPFRGGDRANWPGEDRRYNPSAGIAVDVGSGGSGHTTIRDVEVGGFGVGVVTFPDGGDANGDFLSLEHCRIVACRDGLSVSHSQSRTVRVDRCTFQCLHTAVTNCQHGKQTGEIDGWIVNSDFNQVYRLCRITQGWAGPTVFQSCYGELVWSLGDFDSGGSRTANRTVFRDCRFDLRAEPGRNDLITDGGYVLLDGGIYSTNDLPVCGSTVEVRGAKFRPAYYEMLGPFPTGRKLAANRFPLIDRPHPAKTGTGIGDVKSVAYFPNPESSDYQVSRETPPGPREYRVWEKRFCKYEPDVESLTLPVGAKPDRGDVIQCDVTLTAWAVVQVAADGRTCAMERINHRGRSIPTGGHWYLMKGQ